MGCFEETDFIVLQDEVMEEDGACILFYGNDGHLKTVKMETGEMTSWLKALAVLM